MAVKKTDRKNLAVRDELGVTGVKGGSGRGVAREEGAESVLGVGHCTPRYRYAPVPVGGVQRSGPPSYMKGL
jgi:hypothetical protein